MAVDRRDRAEAKRARKNRRRAWEDLRTAEGKAWARELLRPEMYPYIRRTKRGKR